MRLLAFILLFGFFSAQAQKRIALTFDDLPSASPKISLKHTQELNNKLLATLEAYNVPATGFVNEAEIDVKNETTERQEILRQWVNKGHTLGNHTYSHSDYNKVGFEAYTADINKGEIITQSVLQEKNKTLTYFRPPFLRTGESTEAKEQLENFLRKKGYVMAPATSESSDHIFNLLYLKAKLAGDSTAMYAVTQDYLQLVAQRLAHSEELSEKVFKTGIPQIYLCHANDLNADNLDSLIKLLKTKGYTIISLEEALSHPVFQQKDPYVGENGPTWAERFAISNDSTRSYDRPMVPADTKAAYNKVQKNQFWFLLQPRMQAMFLANLNASILFLVTLICLVTYIQLKYYK